MRKTFPMTNGVWARLFILSVSSIGMLPGQPARAQNPAGSASATGPCNLAIVSKMSGAHGRSCDEKTIREMARHGQVYEQNQLGIASILAIAPDYSTAEALKWLERAAQRGYAPAQVNLAVMYSNGWGTPANNAKALYWLQLAVDQKYPRAYFDLGVFYLQGRGCDRTTPRHSSYFEKAPSQETPALRATSATCMTGAWAPRRMPKKPLPGTAKLLTPATPWGRTISPTCTFGVTAYLRMTPWHSTYSSRLPPRDTPRHGLSWATCTPRAEERRRTRKPRSCGSARRPPPGIREVIICSHLSGDN